MNKQQYIWAVVAGFSIAAMSFWGIFHTRQLNAHQDLVTNNLEQIKKLPNVIDVAIIGSGPAGLTAALYSRHLGLNPYVFEGPLFGGLLMQTGYVENWPGEKSIQGPELMGKLKEQVQHHGVRFISQSVSSLDVSSWPYKLTTEDGKEYHFLSGIFTLGASPSRLGVKGEDQYWGNGVTACAVCDAPFFKNQSVVVVGGGDSAAEEALQLVPFASDITILVRKESMRAAASMQKKVKENKKISVLYNVEIKEIVGDGKEVTGVQLYNNKTKETKLLPTKGVFLAIGHIPNTKILESKVKLNAQGYIELVDRQQTSVSGIFAAGDAEDHVYRQAIVAAGSGCKAAMDTNKWLEKQGYSAAIKEQIQGQFPKEQDEEEDGNIIEVTTQNELQKITQEKGVVLVDFFADYCPSCLEMLPHYKEVANKYAEKAKFVTVDVGNEATEQLAESLHIQRIPCVLVYKDGSLVARFTNAMKKSELEQLINRFI